MTAPNAEKLDQLLAEVRAMPAAGLPDSAGFEEHVWKRIDREIALQERSETSEAIGFRAWLERLAALVLQPREVAVALLLVLCGAVGVTTLAARQQGGEHAAPVVSLGLEVFSGHAPALPSTLMSRHP